MRHRPGAASDGGSWRRSGGGGGGGGDSANNRANDITDGKYIPAQATEEDVKARAAMKELQNRIASFINGMDNANGCSINFIEQLASSLFDTSGPSSTSLDEAEADPPAKSLPKISAAVIWDSAYSCIRIMQALSQSGGDKSKCSQLIHEVSPVALACLRSLIHNLQQHKESEQHSRPLAISDIRLCECASIILKLLSREGPSSLGGDATEVMIIMSRKATLFSCLAKLLAISTMNSHDSHPSPKGRERRGPLASWGSEKAVNLIVKQAVLPYLDSMTRTDNADIAVSAKFARCHGAMECLYLLLKDPNWVAKCEDTEQTARLSKHAGAILAPLVVDVLPDGKEKQRANPLRTRTLAALNKYWEMLCEVMESGKQPSCKLNQATVMPCQCMAVALSAVRAVRKGKAQSNQISNGPELNVPSIARQLQIMMQIKELENSRRKFLKLLTLLCLAYPNAAAGQWHLFIEQSALTVSPLLALMKEGISVIERGDYDKQSWNDLPSAINATSALLSAMPFALWISCEGRPSTRISGGNFSSRVRDSLLNVLRCALDLMEAFRGGISSSWLSHERDVPYAQSIEMAMHELSSMAGKLCTILPFRGENDTLLTPASRLVSCAGDIFFHCTKMIASNPPTSELELKNTLLYNVMLKSSYVITESLGVDLSGDATATLSAPAAKWLSDSSSFDFIGMLLSDSCWKYPASKVRLEMLALVARRSPWTITREPFNLASYCEICKMQCSIQNESMPRFLGIKLIDSLMVGRKISFSDGALNSMMPSVVPETFCPLLVAAMNDGSGSGKLRSFAISSFSTFMKNDWATLLFPDVGRLEGRPSVDWSTLESILNLCSIKREKDHSVRNASCKAISDISTACISDTSLKEENGTYEEPFTDDFVHSFICKICEVMSVAILDPDASVRSMVSGVAMNRFQHESQLLMHDPFYSSSRPCMLLGTLHVR